MNKYIGVKIIQAEPMTLIDAEEKLQRKIKSGNEDGYLVAYPDGYESWSPKIVFEEAYRESHGLTFGLAIESLKKGLRVARTGWNGKGMWLKYIPMEDFGYTGMLPFIALKLTDDNFIPWNASQADVLADDWMIVE